MMRLGKEKKCVNNHTWIVCPLGLQCVQEAEFHEQLLGLLLDLVLVYLGGPAAPVRDPLTLEVVVVRVFPLGLQLFVTHLPKLIPPTGRLAAII